MKDLESYTTVVDDFQHQMENKIKNYTNDQGFPQKGSLTEEELSNYLFDYQAALDSEGSERSRYTIAGVLLILPILVMSAIPEYNLPFANMLANHAVAIGVGLVLFLVYRLLMKVLVRHRIHRVNQTYPEARVYIDKVKAFKSPFLQA